MTEFGQHLDRLAKALSTLEGGLEIVHPSQLERDGIIQRFEFTFELSWKTMRRFFIAQGRIDVNVSPKPVLREALAEGLIDDLDSWFRFLEARNLSTHVYREEDAESVFQAAKGFPEFVKKLILQLKDSP